MTFNPFTFVSSIRATIHASTNHALRDGEWGRLELEHVPDIFSFLLPSSYLCNSFGRIKFYLGFVLEKERKEYEKGLESKRQNTKKVIFFGKINLISLKKENNDSEFFKSLEYYMNFEV